MKKAKMTAKTRCPNCGKTLETPTQVHNCMVPAKLPKEPPHGLLMSMAIRYDHGLGVPGYYDSPLFAGSGLTHQQRLDGALVTMAQLYEEVSGRGFFKWEEVIK
jgi:hypothetical protein